MDHLVGWCGNYNPDDNMFSYIVGVLVKPNANVPEGMVNINIDDLRYAVGTIKGTETDI